MNTQTVVSKIDMSAGKYDVSTSALIYLKNQKVPDEVIDAIVKKAEVVPSVPKNAPSSAISKPAASALLPAGADLDFVNVIHYHNKATNNLMKLERSTVAVKAKVNILKAMVPGTSIPIIFKMDGATSTSKVAGQEGLSFMVNTGINTPEIFGMYRMQIKKDKREATWFNVSAFENKSDKDVIAFNYRKAKEGVYEIVPVSRLEKGEYCFVNKTSYNTYGGSKANVFAFAVE